MAKSDSKKTTSAKAATKKVAKKKVSKKKAAKKVSTNKAATTKAASKSTATKVTASKRKTPVISEEERRMMIAVHAYYKWEQAGFPGDQDWQNWLDAEKEVEQMLK
jgi:hypothetical protein